MTRLFAVGSYLLAFGLMSIGLSAQAAEGRHALIVGIGNYSQASMTPPLKGVPVDVANARKMAEAMGVPPSAIVELRDSAATKPRILREFARLRDTVKPGDRVLVYWSGHGARFSGPNGCIEGLQTYTEGVFQTTDVMSEAELATHLQPISRVADKVITVMDACFSGGVIRGNSRGMLDASRLRAKFSDHSGGQCNIGINQPRTRGLLSEISRLGVQQENFVQIAAAADNEVSWDDEISGGVATNALTQCLLGEAKDLNGSGAVSLEEVRVCAQVRMNRSMAPFKQSGMLPSTMQIKGNRNLVVAPAVPAPPVVPVALPPPTVVSPPPVAIRPPATVIAPTKPPTSQTEGQPPSNVALNLPPPTAAPPSIAPPKEDKRPADSVKLDITQPQRQETVQSLPGLNPVQDQTTPAAPAQLGSRGTLEDILNQRDPRIELDVSAPKQLTIGRDRFAFTVKPSSDGYLYAVLLGSDEKSFYLLFPNKLDSDNRVKANQSYSMPRPGWQVGAAGPEGTDRILFVLSQSPRDPKIFVSDDSGAGGPFSYSVADLPSRQRLVDFFLGRGVKGRNGAMGATMIDVEEVR